MRIKKQDNDSAIIDFMRRDCAGKGHGRKKWWAERLGVSQMTLSHWFVGRRKPNAAHWNTLFTVSEELQANNEKEMWSNWLWQKYYDNREIEPILLKQVAKNLMKTNGLQSRVLALLSWFFTKLEPPLIEQSDFFGVSRWQNKMGWLYESAGLESDLKPARLSKPGTVLDMSNLDISNSDVYRSYLESQQTDLGRKWQLYDCALDELKEKLDWRH